MTSIDKLIEFIRDWKLSQPHLAEKIGVNPNTFNNKIMAREGYKWNAQEKASLFQVFSEMRVQLDEALNREPIPREPEKEIPKRTIFVTTKLKQSNPYRS